MSSRPYFIKQYPSRKEVLTDRAVLTSIVFLLGRAFCHYYETSEAYLIILVAAFILGLRTTDLDRFTKSSGSDSVRKYYLITVLFFLCIGGLTRFLWKYETENHFTLKLSLIIAGFEGLIVGLVIGLLQNSFIRIEVEKFRKSAESASAITDALEKYRMELGFYPEHLQDIVPYYLPELPSTGMNHQNPFSGEFISGKETFRYDLFDDIDSPLGKSYYLSIPCDEIIYFYQPGLTETGFLKIRHEGLFPILELEQTINQRVQGQA